MRLGLNERNSQRVFSLFLVRRNPSFSLNTEVHPPHPSSIKESVCADFLLAAVQNKFYRKSINRRDVRDAVNE